MVNEWIILPSFLSTLTREKLHYLPNRKNITLKFACLLLTILSHWYRFPLKCNLYWSAGSMWLARCFNNKGRQQSLFSGLFQVFCPFSFLFLETWEWPPAQSNDLGFKCEMLAWSKCLKGAFHQEQEVKCLSFLCWHMMHPSDHLWEKGCYIYHRSHSLL